MSMKKIVIILAAIAALTGCHKETPDQVGHDVKDGQMRFTMSVGTPSKANDAEFESGDKVGLFVVEYNGEIPAPLQISGNWANNVAVTFNGTVWNPVKTVYWPETGTNVDVYGYYPYMHLISVDEQPFSVALDQSTLREGESLGGYEASDLLWAKTENVASTQESVSLSYKHIMSKLVVKLVKGDKYTGDLPDASELYIHNVVPDAMVNLTNGSVVKDMYSTEKTIKANRINDSTFEAIIVPQRLESSRPFIELISYGVSYLLEDSFYFRNGKVHVLELIINGNPDQISVEIGGEIQNWN